MKNTADAGTSAAVQVMDMHRKEFCHMNYNTSGIKKTGFYIIMGLLAVIIIGLSAANIALDRQRTWDVEYEMVNRHVEWTYAGK